MPTNHRFRIGHLGITTLLACTLGAPIAANAEEQDVAMAPAPGPTWDETSGDTSVEASRTAASDVYALPADDTAGEATSGYRSLEENRVIAAQRALLSNELGSLQEEALAARVADARTWDEPSDSSSVEAALAARLAQFRAIELALSSSLGAGQGDLPSCASGG
jgi:hypothetical protein